MCAKFFFNASACEELLSVSGARMNGSGTSISLHENNFLKKKLFSLFVYLMNFTKNTEGCNFKDSLLNNKQYELVRVVK